MFTTIGDGTGLAWELARLRLARQDQETNERLRRQCGLPDPDERPENDPPPTCEVCGQPHLRSPRGRPSSAVICTECSRKGWRSRRCECGNLLHTRDYVSNAKRKRNGLKRPEACRACRLAAVALMRGEAA